MKRLLLLFSCLLCLCGCNGNNARYKQESKYSQVVWYQNVKYRFDDYFRCCVKYDHYSGDDEHGHKYEYTLEWCVYLNGFITNGGGTYAYNYFIECKKNGGGYDYYIYVSMYN